MRIKGRGRDSYLFIGGVSLPREVSLGDGITLRPVTRQLDPNVPILSAVSPWETQVIALYLPSVTAELHVQADDERALVVRSWNALWDLVLVGALYDCETACNIQSDTSARDFGPATELMLTNFHFRGMVPEKPRVTLSEDDVAWLEANAYRSRVLMREVTYSAALHSLASYRWHPDPRIQLAVIWAGIEGLFGVDSELSFRVSLYAARFLAPTDVTEQRRVFRETKSLYSRRSEAVHGAKIRGGPDDHVKRSAGLLRRLVRECLAKGALPDAGSLAP